MDGSEAGTDSHFCSWSLPRQTGSEPSVRRTLGHIRPGTILGELAILDEGARSATLIADRPSQRGMIAPLYSPGPHLSQACLLLGRVA
jgi:hypothetical protein